MGFEIERSIGYRKCKLCDKKIGKAEKHLKETFNFNGFYKPYSNYCIKCGIWVINERINELDKLRDELNV